MNFLIDTQLPPRLAKFLTTKEHNAIHTTHFPNGHLLDDQSIRKIAINEDRIIVTKDNDFFDSFLIKGAPPKVLLLRFGNLSNDDLLSLFNSQLHKIEQLFKSQNASLVEFYLDKLVQF